jgi:NitT/TauT family transport system substrate-binding protein
MNPISIRRAGLLLALLVLAGCGKAPAPAGEAKTAAAPAKVRFQCDWYPQTEHGGFYQAVAQGFYRDAGLDVDILSGGPGATVPQKLLGGVADIAMGRSDDIIFNVSSGLPFVIVGVFMQHDPQGILVHEESSVTSFKDLDGKSLMAVPGSNWISYIQAHYGVQFSLKPLNFGLAQFMADKTFIQQCFVTNEPYYVRKNGAKPRVLLLADAGYNPYRVIFTTQKFLREHPERVRAFVAASLRGWEDFMAGDNTAAKKLITARNEQMTPEFMAYSQQAMVTHKLIAGDPALGEQTGLLTRKRLQEQMELLVQLKIIPAPLPVEKFANFDFLPPALRAKVD